MMFPLRLIPALTLIALSACGPMQSQSIGLNAVTGIFQGAMASRGADATADPRQGLTRAQFEDAPAPLILAYIEDRNAAGTLTQIGTNANRETWVTLDGISLTLMDGILVATRGLGDDLMGADVADLHSLLPGTGGTVRIHDYMTGTDQIVRRSFQCTVTAGPPETIEIVEETKSVRRYDEDCVNPTQSYRNSYWIDAAGRVWKSRQLVSEGVGYLEIERL